MSVGDDNDTRTWKVVRLAVIEPASTYLSRRLLMMVHRPAYPVTPYIILFWDEDTGNYFNSHYFVHQEDAENRFNTLKANHLVEEDVEYAEAVKSGRIQPIII